MSYLPGLRDSRNTDESPPSEFQTYPSTVQLFTELCSYLGGLNASLGRTSRCFLPPPSQPGKKRQQ